MTANHSLKLGFLLPTRGILIGGHQAPDPHVLFELAQLAEDSDFDSLWVGDSLLAKPRLEPLSTLAAIAMKTKQIRLGTAVLLAPLRNPVHLAQMASTVDLLSNGRLSLGMGVGGVFNQAQRMEWLAAGIPPQERGKRMNEIIRICRKLWTEEEVSFKGEFFQLVQASLNPKPAQQTGIPILLACHYGTGSEPQYKRAAQYADGIISISDSPEEYSQTLINVERHRTKGASPSPLNRNTFYLTININRDPDAAWREADQFIRDYYGGNYWEGKWGPFGSPDDVTERILEYCRAGAQEIIIRFASPNQLLQLNTFVSEVLQNVRQSPINWD